MPTHDETCSKPKFGIIDESRLSLQYPREVDDTFHTLDEATAAALNLLKVEGWMANVTVCLVDYNKHGNAVETRKSFELAVNGRYQDLILDDNTDTDT